MCSLMFEKQGLGRDGAYPAGAEKFREDNEEVNGEEEKIAHGSNAITLANLCKTSRRPRLAL